MSDATIGGAAVAPASQGASGLHTSDEANRRLRRRYAAEKRLKAYGIAAIAFALGSLVLLLTTVLANGLTAFVQTRIVVPITFDSQVIDPSGQRNLDEMRRADYAALVRAGLERQLPDLTSRQDRRLLASLTSAGAPDQLREMVMADPGVIGQTRNVALYASSDIDMLQKGYIDRTEPEANRRVNDRQIAVVDRLVAAGAVTTQFNWRFFTAADSREPELVGVLGGVVGSALTLLICIVVALPLGIAAAIYLEEFAPKGRLSELIEVNINNLGAVPSIVYGLLGVAVFLNFLDMPRSAPLVGGLVIALMSLPVIIIAARAAIRAVPPSIREAALGLGASKVQVTFHHVLPLAMPGVMTGTIIAMAAALGETAPLLMIGMVAFIVDVPGGPLEAATVLPVQIFMWADSPERGFIEKTSAGIIVLLVFLLAMNALAIYLRKKFERRW